MLALLVHVAKHATDAVYYVVHQTPAAIQQVVQQTAQQVPSIIHVTVQQPLVGGMPEWAKTLISASVGAFFAILSSVLLEYRHNRKIRKQAEEQVIAELMENMDLVSSHWKYLSSSDEQTAKDDENEIAARTLLILKDINRDRYGHYFEEHKPILYGIDPKKRLFSFYKAIGSLQAFAEVGKAGGVMVATEGARLYGIEFLKEKGIDYQPKPTIYDKMDELKKKGLWPRD